MRTDLAAEMASAIARVRQPHLDQLVAMGVSPVTIADLGAVQPPFGIMNAAVSNDGLFMPGDGPAHIVQPIISNGEIIDLVAWRSMQPNRWWLRTGLGWALGEDNWTYRSAWDADKPFPVHATPLGWLRSGAVGIAVVDWDAPEVRGLLDADTLLVGSLAFGETLIATLSRRARVPHLKVQESAHAA